MKGYGEGKKKKEMENSKFERLVLELKLVYYHGNDNMQHDICAAIESQMENLKEREDMVRLCKSNQ